jgi:nitrogen fixation protein NifB
VDPAIGEQIYSWMRIDKKVVPAARGASLLLERQLAAITALKRHGILVKVNSILLPGINDRHMTEVAKTAGGLGVDLFNCMPYYPNAGSALENLAEPGPEMVSAIRAQAGHYVKQMGHCTRCRADAVGLLGEAPSSDLMATLQSCQHLKAFFRNRSAVSQRPYVAVASMEGVLVNQHLGEAYQLLIYGEKDGRIDLLEARPTPEPGSGTQRWQQLARTLSDCRTLLVSGVGPTPRQALTDSGVQVLTCEGLIDDAVHRIFDGQSLDPLAVRSPKACKAGCSGNTMGCGS